MLNACLARLMVCTVLMLASISITIPVRAEDSATGWFDTISEFFAQLGDKRVTVPKRRTAAPPTPGAPEGGEAVQPTRAAAPAGGAESREPMQASPAEGAVGAPDNGDAEQSTPADAAARRVVAERPAASISEDVIEESDGMQPSRALHAVEGLIAEIQGIRRATGIDDFPPEAELTEGRTPIHSCSLSATWKG